MRPPKVKKSTPVLFFTLLYFLMAKLAINKPAALVEFPAKSSSQSLRWILWSCSTSEYRFCASWFRLRAPRGDSFLGWRISSWGGARCVFRSTARLESSTRISSSDVAPKRVAAGGGQNLRGSTGSWML